MNGLFQLMNLSKLIRLNIDKFFFHSDKLKFESLVFSDQFFVLRSISCSRFKFLDLFDPVSFLLLIGFNDKLLPIDLIAGLSNL